MGAATSARPRWRSAHFRAVQDVWGESMSKLVTFFRDESGASAAEYALILAIVGIGIVTAATALKGEIGGAMNRTADTIKTAS